MSRLSRLGFIDTHRTTDPVRRRPRSRGVPPALDGREIFYTEDSDEAQELIGKALAPNHLTLGPLGSNEFSASLHGARFRDVSLLYLDLHVAATLDITHCGRYFAVHMPMNGRAVGTIGPAGALAGGAGAGGAGGRTEFEANTIRALVTNPDDELTIRFDHDSPQLIVRFEAEALERYLTRLSGRMMTHELRFEPTFDLTTDAATRWHSAIQMLHTEVFYSGSLVHDGIGIGPLEDFLMSSLLMIHQSTYREQLIRTASAPGRRAVRQAVDYIEHHLSEPLTMTGIADEVGVSVRSIQQGFRDELGVPPMEYLRERRLERVREELVDAEAGDGVTVTAVAERWGFNHLGSFSAMYRKRWGETPSQTLQRLAVRGCPAGAGACANPGRGGRCGPVHELSICGSIASIAQRHAAGRPVAAIHVRVGQLRQIVPDTLVYCWGLVSEDTPLAGSKLELETVPGRITCRACDAVTEIGDMPVFACGACGGTDAEVTSGEEFLITSLDLAEGANT